MDHYAAERSLLSEWKVLRVSGFSGKTGGKRQVALEIEGPVVRRMPSSVGR